MLWLQGLVGDEAAGTVGCWGPEATDIRALYKNLGRLEGAYLILTFPFKETFLLSWVKPMLVFQAQEIFYKEGILMNQNIYKELH